MNEWTDTFTTSSMPSQDTRNDFFHVVPPTPFDFGQENGHGQAHAHGHALGNTRDVDFYHPQNPNHDIETHSHHLRPTSIRSHRSTSHGSISSTLSGFSNNTQWGSESDFTDPSVEFHVDPRLFQTHPKENAEDEAGIEVLASPALAPEMTTTASPRKKTKKAKTAEEKAERKKVSHARKQCPEHIPRPRNAFILFRKHVVDSKLIPTSVEIRHQNVSIITAKMWSEASPEQKAHFNELAKIEKEEHLKKYPGYRYQPVYRRTNVIRRRVRKDQAEEEKCNNVAQLLMEGKTGERLAEEIREGSSKKKEKVSAPVTNGARAPSKKGHANELSKGALRALRAQSRQTGDWSDNSRSVSRVVSPEPDLDDFEDSPQVDYSYLEGPGPVLVPDVYAQPQPHWGYQQPIQQSYLSDQTLGTTYTQQSAYYAYDQALPFSPNGTTTFHPHAQPQPQPGVFGMRQGSQDMVFSGFPESGFQSPIGHMMPGPFSARWDGLFDLSGQGVLLDGVANGGYDGNMDFGGGDMMLHDFGAALAQADDMTTW